MNWYVLFVQTNAEDKFCKLLNRDQTVQVFSAKYEYYRRDSKSVQIKSLFPGYLFIKTEMEQKDFDTWMHKIEFKSTYFRQLKYDHTSALTKEEVASLEKLLDEDFVLRMSYGELVNKKLVIKEGPLIGFDDYITKFDKHNALVKLDLFFIDQQWVAGAMLIENKQSLV